MVQIQKYRDFYGLYSKNIAIFVDYVPKIFKTRVKYLDTTPAMILLSENDFMYHFSPHKIVEPGNKQ